MTMPAPINDNYANSLPRARENYSNDQSSFFCDMNSHFSPFPP